MRKLTYTMMVSLDGFIEGPDPKLDWVVYLRYEAPSSSR
jgi:hypothetical protein